jgi:hypothetical protein
VADPSLSLVHCLQANSNFGRCCYRQLDALRDHLLDSGCVRYFLIEQGIAGAISIGPQNASHIKIGSKTFLGPPSLCTSSKPFHRRRICCTDSIARVAAHNYTIPVAYIDLVKQSCAARRQDLDRAATALPIASHGVDTRLHHV